MDPRSVGLLIAKGNRTADTLNTVSRILQTGSPAVALGKTGAIVAVDHFKTSRLLIEAKCYQSSPAVLAHIDHQFL